MPYTIEPLAGDASFRRYFRLHSNGLTRVIMDAPPNKETIAPFVHLTKILNDNNIYSPLIYAIDSSQGFILLEDFGDELLLNTLEPHNADKLYTLAIETLHQIQKIPVNPLELPAFDKTFMLNELELFHNWFLNAYLSYELTTDEEQLLKESFDWLTNEISKEPLVFIHRDYHSRNLMLVNNRLGVIDFQDAMVGPRTYDLVSLLKDCYIQWPPEKISQWLADFHNRLDAENRGSLSEFQRAFNLCGLQRHLKVLGVFCRLHLRDNKPGYLKDLPLTFNYALSCTESHVELHPFYHFLDRKIRPLFLEKTLS